MNLQSPAFKPDGWSSRTRLGLIVPHADVGPEAECGALAGPNISIHAARLDFSAMRAGGEMDPTIPHDPVEAFTRPPYLDDAVGAICLAPISALGLAFTSSAYKHGPAGDRRLIERLKPRTRGIPVVTTCLAAEEALRLLGVSRMAIVNPAWFDADLDAAGARYFRDAGFEVVQHAPCGLASGQNHVTPQALYDWIAGQIAETRAEAIFVGGNGQRAIGIIDAVERSFGLKMLTANQVLYWAALRAAGASLATKGYGVLLSESA